MRIQYFMANKLKSKSNISEVQLEISNKNKNKAKELFINNFQIAKY